MRTARATIVLAALLVAPTVVVIAPAAEASGSIPPQWTARFDTPSRGDETFAGFVVAPDASRAFVAGTTARVPGVGGGDVVVRAHDAATGAVLWSRTWDGPLGLKDNARRVAIAPDGARLFVAGESEILSTGENEMFLLALDAADGAIAWTATFRGESTGGRSYARALAVTPDGARVYLGGGTGEYGKEWAVVAYRASDGLAVWDARFSPLGSPGSGSWPDALVVSPDMTRVYGAGKSSQVFRGSDFATFALDAADGAVLWRKGWKGTGANDDGARAIAVAPDGGRIYVAGYAIMVGKTRADFATVAYASDGAELWNATQSGPGDEWDTLGAAAVSADGGTLFVAGHARGPVTLGYTDPRLTVIAYDPATGARRWTNETTGRANAASSETGLAIGPDGLVHASGTNGNLVAATFDPLTGERRWLATYAGPRDVDEGPGLALAGSRVLVAGSSRDLASRGDLATVAFARATGATDWVERYDGPGSADEAVGDVVRSPDGSRYFVTGSATGTDDVTDAFTLAVRATDGAHLWRKNRAGGFGLSDLGESIAVSPDGAKVYSAGKKFKPGNYVDIVTTAYSADTGNELWSHVFTAPRDFPGYAVKLSVAPNGTAVYVATTDRPATAQLRAYSLDAATGGLRWSSHDGLPASDDYIEDAALSADGTLLVVTGTARRFSATDKIFTAAFRTWDGARAWNATYAGSPTGDDVAAAVATGGGFAFVAGTVNDVWPHRWRNASVVAYRLADGAETWSASWDGASGRLDLARDVAASADGSRVVVPVYSEISLGSWRWVTLALDGGTGAEAWNRTHEGATAPVAAGFTAGDRLLAATGSDWTSGTGEDVRSIAYDPATGAVSSFAAYDGPGEGSAHRDDRDVGKRIAPGNDDRSFLVAAESDGGPGGNDLVLIHYRAGDPPSKPLGLVAERGARAGEIALSWSPPLSSGSLSVEKYVVYRGAPGGPRVAVGESASLSFVDAGLAAATAYEYAVTAASGAGEGPASDPATATTHPPPGPPTAVAADRGPALGEIRVRWQPPADTAGLPVTGYRVYGGDAAESLALLASLGASARSHVDGGLARETRRYYAVSALTDAGEGARSPVVDQVSPGPPGAPISFSGAGGPQPGEITVRWGPPADTGGAPVTGYRVYRGSDAAALAPLADVPGGEASYTDRGLPNGASYWYAVSATNGFEGPTTAPRLVATPGPPTRPAYTAARSGPDLGEITVSWLPPGSDGGTAVTAYRVYRGTTWTELALLAEKPASARSHVDAGLPANARYYYAVTAVNGVGEGPRGDVVTAAAPDYPGPPRAVHAAPGTLPGQVRVSWGPPASGGNLPIDAYLVYRSEDDGASWTLAASVSGLVVAYTDSGRPPLTPILYRVAAVNRVGEGQPSAPACTNAGPWIGVGAAVPSCARVLP